MGKHSKPETDRGKTDNSQILERNTRTTTRNFRAPTRALVTRDKYGMTPDQWYAWHCARQQQRELTMAILRGDR